MSPVRIEERKRIHAEQKRKQSLSMDKRALMEELESLKRVQDRLQAASAKMAEQKKLLERLPIAEQERAEAQKAASEAEEDAMRLKTRVEQLTTDNEEQARNYAMAKVDGFQRAVDLNAVLASRVNFQYSDGMHVARERKISLGDKRVFDPVEYQSDVEEDKEESPGNACGAEPGNT